MGNMIVDNTPILINQEATMSSREIAELVGKEHKHVMRDLRVLSGQLGEMFEGSVQLWTHPQNGQEYQEYVIKRDTCITLITGYDSVARMKVIKRWQELEVQAKPTIPQTYAAALLEAGRLALELEKSQARLEVAAQKADVYDRIVDKNGLYNATQIAQKFGQSAIWLNKQLEELDVYNRSVKRGRAFKQWFMDAGYGIMRETATGHSQPMFFSHGEMWIVKRLAEEGLI